MSFKNLIINKEYRTSNNNVVTEFYIPVLSETVLYQRAVGFFSSSSLIKISDGIKPLVERGGKIQLIVSPKLTVEDIEEISKGYERRREVIQSRLNMSLIIPSEEFNKKKLGYLSVLIEQGILDIKVAFMTKNKLIGMFHEKLGIMEDEEHNLIAFTGSLNDSQTAYFYNYESIDVYCSWDSEDSKLRAKSKKETFEKMWENIENDIEVIDFPKVLKEKLEVVRREYSDQVLMESVDKEYTPDTPKLGTSSENIPFKPENIDIRPYQKDAIRVWSENEYIGIFDMATGTGKTITAINALVHLFAVKKKLAVVIVAPYQHLVEQWLEDLHVFNIRPIVGYSNSLYSNYLTDLKEEIIAYNLGLVKFMCFITTNASFRLNRVQDQISKIKANRLIIVDEAHNFGSPRLAISLPKSFEYRLALSATFERHHDSEGTKALFDYFGKKCIEYSLKKAIKEGFLCNYMYYPIIVFLTNDEFLNYRELTAQVATHIKKDLAGKSYVDEIGKMLLLKRARLVASAANKVQALLETIEKFRDDNGILIYCGATNMIDDNLDETEIRQIDIISRKIYEEHGIVSSQFTSKENREQREQIKDSFVRKSIQAVVAIKCLDEGVNIPSIKTAFILASSTNPKEYVQRRGRVLRKSSNKEYAEIFDFVTLPTKFGEYEAANPSILSEGVSLVKREIERMKEFCDLSLNGSISDEIIHNLEGLYGPYMAKTSIIDEIEEEL